jgi:SAM-dependent methyltransferase
VSFARRIVKSVLPTPAYWWLRGLLPGKPGPPPAGAGRLLGWRRLQPIRPNFGHEQGRPVDRYYIESFLEQYAADVHGRVLEVADANYTRRFGGERVLQSDVLHAKPGNPEATHVGDLAEGAGIPAGTYDCVILSQTLFCIYDVRAAVDTLHRILKPEGTVLVTVPGISQISRFDMEQWGDYWRFTSMSARRLFESAFGPEHVRVHAYGNVLAATAFLHGILSTELTLEELDYCDPDYEVLIAVRAVKDPLSPPSPSPLPPDVSSVRR